MGKKISIDSSTLMNKMLELIEAQKLFNLPSDKFDILIHPNSLVHAIVKLKNGLTKFLYHETSMVIPIANAIFNDIPTAYHSRKLTKNDHGRSDGSQQNNRSNKDHLPRVRICRSDPSSTSDSQV